MSLAKEGVWCHGGVNGGVNRRNGNPSQEKKQFLSRLENLGKRLSFV